MATPLSLAQANFKLALWNAEARSISSSELYLNLQEFDLPEEINSRLHELADFTQQMGSKVCEIGKIVLLKILEFIKAHPFLVTGIGIGGTIGAAIAGLITAIPLLGSLLSPLAMALGIAVTTVGAVMGHRLDKRFKEFGKDVMEIVQVFFELFSDVLNTTLPSHSNS